MLPAQLTLASLTVIIAGGRVPNQSALRSDLDSRIPYFAKTPDADAHDREKFDYPKTLPPSTPCSAKIFVVSHARIHAFRDKLRRSLGDNTKLTICNVLSALIWIHITRARGARLLKTEDGLSSAGIAVDSRRRLEPPLTEEYMGCMAIFAKATLPISNFVAEER